MNRVFVVDKQKQPLMPCHPARARELLKAGQAASVRRGNWWGTTAEVRVNVKSAGVLVGFELALPHWSYLYIPWFFAPAIVALLGIYEPPRRGPRLSLWLPPSGSRFCRPLRGIPSRRSLKLLRRQARNRPARIPIRDFRPRAAWRR